MTNGYLALCFDFFVFACIFHPICVPQSNIISRYPRILIDVTFGFIVLFCIKICMCAVTAVDFGCNNVVVHRIVTCMMND